KRLPRGRIAALEVLIANSAIANYIREAKTYQIPTAMQVGANQGMRLLNDTLLDLVKRKFVDPNEAYIKAVDKQDLKTKFDQIGVKVTLAEVANYAATAPKAASTISGTAKI
ncbi:MAG: hypothetical protein AABZ44_00760, partial [Elusimicrobiota bacterium]